MHQNMRARYIFIRKSVNRQWSKYATCLLEKLTLPYYIVVYQSTTAMELVMSFGSIIRFEILARI
jgi:hypothetical protein